MPLSCCLFKHLINCSFRLREDSKLPAPCALWPVDLKLTHTECSPGNTLVHFQGQYATICELDYNILQVEIQNALKTAVSAEVGDVCLVEELPSSRWYRGRVQNKSGDSFDVFLLDHGNILTVGPRNLSAISDPLLMLPPKIVCGFVANALPLQERWSQPAEAYFSSLIGRHIEGYIHGFLPYKVLVLEVPEITKDLLRLGLGRHVDTDTFLLLVELEMGEPIQQSCESVPDLLIEKQSAQEISFKSSHSCGYENILSLGGSKLAVGQREKVRIAAAVSPGLFYCQLSSAARDLKEMSEKLALVCESRNGDFRDGPGENMGLLCAIQGKDEQWHRGLVQCLPVNSQVRVVFVDYGYCESVKVENILQLPPDFLLRPVMAFPCSLSCMGDEDEATVNRQLVLLSKGLLGKELVITIDGLSEEKSVCSVTLGDAAGCASIETAHYNRGDKILTNPSSYAPNETKDGRILKNLSASEDMRDGAVFEGYVEHVQSPHEFWMRTATSNDRFEAMMNKLTSRFSKLQLNEEILQDPAPGQLCCAMYEKDMHYYRALVVDILEYGAEVFFIDYGNTEKVPSMLIKKIPTELTLEPAFAFNCSLAHVVPLQDVWTTTVTEYFRKATSDKRLLVRVVHRKNGVFVVELYEKGLGRSESIATLLTSANMAEYWTYRVIKTPGALPGRSNRTGKTLTRRQFAGNACTGISQKPPSKVTRQEINKSTDKQVHTDTHKLNKVHNFKCHKITPGSVISVQCSHVISPSDFWCQNKKYKNDLDKLMERLQTFNQTNNPVLQPHSVCCAVHMDNKWYRGCVLEETDRKIAVFLVDYGMVVQENLQKLRALDPDFLELEGQAFRCSLYNLTNPVGGDVWSNEARTLLKKFTSGNCDLTCRIYSQVYVANRGLCNVVDLYTPLQQASTYLVEKGVAMEIEHPKCLPPYIYPCTFVYSSFDIAIGSEELVFPTHVVSPWEIYLQLDRNTEVIEQLMDRAMKESEKLMSPTHTGKTGNVCLAKYSNDGKWYRSFVWPAQSSLHLNVFFVDYGSKQVAEKKSVLSIPITATDLLLTPMQALRCSLLSIPEEEHLPEVKTWLEKAILNKVLRAKFVETNCSGHFICDLFDGDLHINEKVREIFKVHGQTGQSVGKPTNASFVGNGPKNNGRPRVESVVKSQRTPGHSKVAQGNEQPCQKKSSKAKSPQKSPNPKGSPAKDGRGKEKHRPKPTKQPQKEKRAVSSTSNAQRSKALPKVSDLPAIPIAPGFRCAGFVSHCDSAESFFIQMKKDEPTILKMREELNSRPSPESVTSDVKVGDLVSARYDEDLAFYRAAVRGVASGGGVLTVEFVDYGNTATVDKKKIHPLASRFLSQARLSTPCKLSTPSNSEDVEPLLRDTHDKPLMVEFLQDLGHAWEVSVQGFDPLPKSGKSNPAEGMEDKAPDSDQALQNQKLFPAVRGDDASLTSVCETTEVEAVRVKEGTGRLEHGAKDGKVVPEKALGKVQATKATGGCMRKLKTSRKACAYRRKSDEKQDVCQSDLPQKPEIPTSVAKDELPNISNSPGPNSLKTSVELPETVGVDGQDISAKQSPSVVRRPASERSAPVSIPPEKVEIRRLYPAPVTRDHAYSGFAAAVTTPGEFHIVLEDQLLIMNAVSDVLEDLPEDLAPLPEAHLIPGTGCLVKSKEKKKWCRAEIIQCDSRSAIVNLVDYGYCVHLACRDVCELKVLPVELAVLPKITYPCLLRGIKAADGRQWSDHAAVFFQRCVYQKNLKIYFRHYASEEQWVVDVVTSNRNVAKELVDAGHAQYIDAVLGVRFQQGLGHEGEIKSNSVYKARSVEDKQTQSNMEKVPHRSSEEASSKDDEPLSRGCSTGEETQDLFRGSCVRGLQ